MNNFYIDEWEKSSFLPNIASVMGRQLREQYYSVCVCLFQSLFIFLS